MGASGASWADWPTSWLQVRRKKRWSTSAEVFYVVFLILNPFAVGMVCMSGADNCRKSGFSQTPELVWLLTWTKTCGSVFRVLRLNFDLHSSFEPVLFEGRFQLFRWWKPTGSMWGLFSFSAVWMANALDLKCPLELCGFVQALVQTACNKSDIVLFPHRDWSI